MFLDNIYGKSEADQLTRFDVVIAAALKRMIKKKNIK